MTVKLHEIRRAPSGLLFKVIVIDAYRRTAVVRELRSETDHTWSLWPSETVSLDELEEDPIVEAAP